MCTPEVLAAAIEKYIEDEDTLFGELNTDYQSWYKESVEVDISANSQSDMEPTIMNTKTNQTNSETNKEQTVNNGQQQQQQNQECKQPGAMEKTKGFFSNLWDKQGKLIMFVAGVAAGVGGAVGYDTYANRDSASTGGSEQA